jgi:hypothetical protein
MEQRKRGWVKRFLSASPVDCIISGYSSTPLNSVVVDECCDHILKFWIIVEIKILLYTINRRSEKPYPTYGCISKRTVHAIICWWDFVDGISSERSEIYNFQTWNIQLYIYSFCQESNPRLCDSGAVLYQISHKRLWP